MRILCYIGLVGLFAVQAHAQGRVTATTSTLRAAANEVFYIIIEASGGDIQDPDMEPVTAAGIHLDTPSVRSQTSIQMINGQTSTTQSRNWRYPASASREGSVTIPRISVIIDGQEYFTQPIALEITRALDLGAQAPGNTREVTTDDLAFVRMNTDKATLYQGEALTLTMQIYWMDGNVAVEGAPPFPETEGFYPGPEWRNNRTEYVDDRLYQVTEFIRILYPALSGDLTIGEWTWQGAVRWYDQRGRMKRTGRAFRAESIPVTVLPLPEQPANFSGAVGNFQIKAALAGTQLIQGTPVRLTVTLSGQGNPNTLGAPVLPELPWAHVSEPETTVQQHENSPEVVKEFGYLITPLETGENRIPPLNYVYFSPLTKQYETAQTQEFAVSVGGAEGAGSLVAVGGSATDQRNRIEVFDDGILPIITDPGILTHVSRDPGARPSPAAYVSPILPLAVFVCLTLLLRWRGRLASDRGYARRFFAAKRFEKTISDTQGTPDPVETLGRALRQYIADIFNINDAGLTSSDVETVLNKHGIDSDTTALAVRVLRACERAKYAGRASAAEEVHALHAATCNTVERLQATLREKRP